MGRGTKKVESHWFIVTFIKTKCFCTYYLDLIGIAWNINAYYMLESIPKVVTNKYHKKATLLPWLVRLH